MSITLEKNFNEIENNKLDKSTLEGIRKVISKEYFKPNSGLALFYTFSGMAFYLFSILILAYTYINNLYWAWPFAYFLAGTAVTSLFVLGHDCGHQSFFKNNKLNDILGHLFFIAPMYPYYGWKFSHNAHHKYTNKLVVNSNDIYYDNAWIPLTIDRYKELKKNNSFFAFLYKLSRYFPPIGSFFHNIITHFVPSKFNESQRKKVILSQIMLAISIVSIFLISIYYDSIYAFFHFYIIPALFFQFWMSIYTYQHHTSEDMKFYKEDDWNPYKAQISSTYNSLFPRWLSFLHFNIDIHTPHHLSTAIPSYYLRNAYKQLKNSVYKDDILENKFSIKYYLNQVNSCHIWDEVNNKYKKFGDI